MYLSTFKRNWILHYIKPEFLYLPRGKRDSYKEDHIEVEKKPGYMVIILSYRTNYGFLGWTPDITVTYFLRKTKHGTLEDTYFTTTASQSEETTYKKITYDEEGTKHIEEYPAESYTATAMPTSSINYGSISYPADGQWHDIIIYVPEPVEDYDFEYLEFESTLTNVLMSKIDITPAKYNRVSDVIIKLPHYPAYIQFNHQRKVDKEYSMLSQGKTVDRVVQPGVNFKNLTLMSNNTSNDKYHFTIWAKNGSYDDHNCGYLIEPNNSGNLSFSMDYMIGLIQDIAEQFPTTTISVFLYDITSTLSVGVPTYMDIDWAISPRDISIINYNYPGTKQVIPLYNNHVGTMTIDGTVHKLYKLSDSINGSADSVVIQNAIAYQVEKQEEWYDYHSEEDPFFTSSSEYGEDGNTWVVLKNSSSSSMSSQVITLYGLMQGSSSTGYGGYYEETFQKTAVEFTLYELNGSYDAPETPWPIMGNPESTRYTWLPELPDNTSSTQGLKITRTQFQNAATQARVSLSFVNAPPADNYVRWQGEIMDIISPITVSGTTTWHSPWYTHDVFSTIDFSRKYTTGQIVPSASYGQQGQYKLSDLTTKGIFIDTDDASASYENTDIISWDTGQITHTEKKQAQLIGKAYEETLYFSETSRVINFEATPGVWEKYNTYSITPNVTVTAASTLTHVADSPFDETKTEQTEDIDTLSKKAKANLKVIQASLDYIINHFLHTTVFEDPVSHQTIYAFDNDGGWLYFDHNQTNYSLMVDVDDIDEFTWNTEVSYYNFFDTKNPSCVDWVAHNNNG